jgi:hypothetical protein
MLKWVKNERIILNFYNFKIKNYNLKLKIIILN